MRIRSITLGSSCDQLSPQKVKAFFKTADSVCDAKGLKPRTCRIALSPFTLKNKDDGSKVLDDVKEVSKLCENSGIRWFGIPFAVANNDASLVNPVALEIASNFKNAFINYIVTDDGTIDRQAVLAAANFISEVSKISDNGFDNFRCGASLNCDPNGAFFPFTHHEDETSFSVALELVPLCVQIVKENTGKTIEQIRSLIKKSLVKSLGRINDTCLEIEATSGTKYYGIDASLAPHPEHPEHSVAYLVELLGVKLFGDSGTIFLTSYLTDTIKSAVEESKIRSTGFNGVMYSVLEDPRLGIVNNESSTLSIDSLTAFSAMCGCGIDMVPIPGDTTPQQIASIILDTAAFAIRLKKPLGVRLLPIPNKIAGDITDFDHDFLFNTKIQPVAKHGCDKDFFSAERPFDYFRP